eukprot:m.50562 g.50562  ORF g.50562 m.50562 type:complete len:160 (-) comp11597_c0_seq3:28-507(-)
MEYYVEYQIDLQGDAALRRAAQSTYAPPTLPTDPLLTLFVSGLSFATNEETLRRQAERHGRVKTVTIVRDAVTGCSKGYGFVEFCSTRDARAAYQKMHRTSIDDKQILVDLERGRTMKGWVPRREGGGLGGRKESGQLRFGGRTRPFRGLSRPRSGQAE